MDPFQMALDVLFASDMAVDAVYVAGGDAPAPVRVIRSKPSQTARFGTMQVALASETIEIRKSEAPQPAPGHAFVIGAETLTIPDQLDPISDVEGLTWTCWVEPQP